MPQLISSFVDRNRVGVICEDCQHVYTIVYMSDPLFSCTALHRDITCFESSDRMN